MASSLDTWTLGERKSSLQTSKLTIRREWAHVAWISSGAACGSVENIILRGIVFASWKLVHHVFKKIVVGEKYGKSKFLL